MGQIDARGAAAADARLAALAGASGQAMVAIDGSGRITEWAGQAEAIFGWRAEEVLGRRLEETIIPPFYRGAHLRGLECYRASGEGRLLGRPIELRALRRDGTEFPAEVLVVPVDHGDGGLEFTALLRDVTQRRHAERLAEMQLAVGQLLMVAAGSGLDGVTSDILGVVGETLRCQVALLWVADADGGGLRLQHSWHADVAGLDTLCDRVGATTLPEAELIERMHRAGEPFVVHTGMGHHALLARAEESGMRWMAAFPVAHARPLTGVLVLLAAEILPIGEGLRVAMSNVGTQLGQALARAALEGDLRHQALHDQLTGLANRALFADRLEHALRRSARQRSCCAVLLLDLDDFKRVNDTRGHQVGDRLIQAMAERLVERLRPADLVARLGGDEFAMLLEDLAAPGEALRAAERVIDAFREPFTIEGRELAAGASVGVALSTGTTGSDEILRSADLAMYVAKSRGGGRYQLFEQSMLTATVERVALEHEMRGALPREEFSVLYQPQVDIVSGRITGGEALVRWNHPTRGWLEAHAFIAHAEESRLIGALGGWVLRTACLQAQEWVDRGLPPVRIAVNISARELEDPELESRIRTVLAESGITASRLELEITETAAVGQNPEMLARLARLRALGVGIAIDDFGTGYSMLSCLRAFPVNRLKIDRSFIEAITLATDAAPLVAAMIAMAHALGLSVTAEGVERSEQQHYLRMHHCDEAQGYLLGRPVPAATFEEMLRLVGRGAA